MTETVDIVAATRQSVGNSMAILVGNDPIVEVTVAVGRRVRIRLYQFP